MHSSLVAFWRTNYFIAFIAIASVLLIASAATADVVFKSYSQNDSSDATSTEVTVDRPASTVAGDFLLANIAVNGGDAANITPPSGWTLISRTDNDSNIGIASY